MSGIGEVASISVNGVAASHTWGAIFEVHSMPGSGPYDLHVTMADGSSVCLSPLLHSLCQRFVQHVVAYIYL